MASIPLLLPAVSLSGLGHSREFRRTGIRSCTSLAVSSPVSTPPIQCGCLSPLAPTPSADRGLASPSVCRVAQHRHSASKEHRHYSPKAPPTSLSRLKIALGKFNRKASRTRELRAAQISLQPCAVAGECQSGSLHGHSILHKRTMSETRQQWTSAEVQTRDCQSLGAHGLRYQEAGL